MAISFLNQKRFQNPLELWEVANGIGKAGLGKDTLEVSIEFIKDWLVLLFCFILYPTGIEQRKFNEERQLFPSQMNILFA